MVATGFSAFESLLVKSPHQRESAELLLLCWVFANKHVPLDEDRRYLERLAARAHHRRDLETLLAAARRQDLGDVQLAAEVLTKEQSGPIIAFLRQAVVVATSDGALSLRNHHILRFLADLCEVSPDTLRALYREVTGRDTWPRRRTSSSSASGISRRKRDGRAIVSRPWRRRISA